MSTDLWAKRCKALRVDLIAAQHRVLKVMTELGIPPSALRPLVEAFAGDWNAVNSLLGGAFEVLVHEWLEANIVSLIPDAKEPKKQWLPDGANARRGGINPLDRIIVGSRHVVGVSPKYAGAAGDAVTIWRQELERLKHTHPGKRCLLLAVKGNGKAFPEALRQGDDERIIAVDFLNEDSRSHAVAQVKLLVAQR